MCLGGGERGSEMCGVILELSTATWAPGRWRPGGILLWTPDVQSLGGPAAWGPGTGADPLGTWRPQNGAEDSTCRLMPGRGRQDSPGYTVAEIWGQK